MGTLLNNLDLFVGGFTNTLILFVISAFFALIIGSVVGAMRVSPVPVMRAVGTVYVNLIRNTPLTLLMVFSVLGMTYILGLNLDPANIKGNAFRWAVVMLSVYHGAFICEALRSGVNTVPVGQAEAARSIGLTFGQSMRHVLLPQAFRGSISPIGSTIIALIKNTTVAVVIGVAEAANLMSVVIENEGSSICVFLVFAIGFVILTLPLGLLFTSLSRRLAVKR